VATGASVAAGAFVAEPTLASGLGRAGAALSSAFIASGAEAAAMAADPRVAGVAGSTYGCPVGLSKSMMTLLRSARTWCTTGCVRVMWTRAAGAPSASIGSTETPAIGPLGFDATELATPSAVTLRKSMSTVSGSGRVAT
jgi:hypothetical protein